LKLCKISDIPEHEKTNLWNAMAENEKFFKPEITEVDFGEENQGS